MDDEWIPADPSTNLIGVSETGRQIFRDAKYTAVAAPCVATEGLPGKVGGEGSELVMLAGAKACKGTYAINPQRKISFRGQPDQHQQYSGKLDFHFSFTPPEDSGYMNGKIMMVRYVNIN